MPGEGSGLWPEHERSRAPILLTPNRVDQKPAVLFDAADCLQSKRRATSLMSAEPVCARLSPFTSLRRSPLALCGAIGFTPKRGRHRAHLANAEPSTDFPRPGTNRCGGSRDGSCQDMAFRTKLWTAGFSSSLRQAQ